MEDGQGLPGSRRADHRTGHPTTSAFKDAFAARVIVDGQVWIDMLDHRNLLSHTYDVEVFAEAVNAIAERYLPAMAELHAFFAAKVAE